MRYMTKPCDVLLILNYLGKGAAENSLRLKPKELINPGVVESSYHAEYGRKILD